MPFADQLGLVMVGLTAEWCQPCHVMKPTINNLEQNNPEIKVIRVDIDKDASLALELKVQNIPCIVFFKDGQEVQRIVGLQSQSDLQSVIDALK